jgi:TonB family protein
VYLFAFHRGSAHLQLRAQEKKEPGNAMSGDREQTTGSGAQEKYEATVLDFLKKETTEVRQSRKSEEYSDELNALVSDLLKQVMEEADQKSGQTIEPEKLEDLLAEFLPLQEIAPVKEAAKPEQAATQASAKAAIAIPEKKAVSPEPRVEPKTRPQEPEKPVPGKATVKNDALFAAPEQAKRGIPKIVIAIAAVLLVAGIAGFLFLLPSSNGPDPASRAGTTTIAPPVGTAALQPVVQPAAPVDSPKPVIPAPDSRSAAENQPAKPSAPAAKNEKPTGPPPQKSAAVPESPTPAPQRVDPPAAAAAVEPPAPASVSATLTAPIEKPAAPAISETIKAPEASVEKKPAQDIASISAGSAATPPEPKASVATAPKNAASAVPLVRANPKYPELAVRSRASASVTLDVSIDSQGKVVKAIPVSGPSIFHNEAIKAAMKWRYKPASIDGTNVPSQSKITFNFNLKN